jgi:hypothetical protein
VTRASRPKRPASGSSARGVPEPGTPERQRVLGELWRRSEAKAATCPIRAAAFAQLAAALGIELPSSDALAELGLAADATETDVRRAYRRLALERHPDRGGSAEAFRALAESYKAALRAVGA